MRSSLQRLLALTALTCVALGGSIDVAGAQEDGREPPPEAVEFYAQAREHYAVGEYREAIEDLHRARAFDAESPTLAYNLGRIHELLGEVDESINFYREYLTLLPEDQVEARTRVEGTITRLEGSRSDIAEGETPPEPPATPPPPTADELDNTPRYVTTRGVADFWVWGTAGLGLALIAGGAAVGLFALDNHTATGEYVLGGGNESEVQTAQEERQGNLDRARSLGLVADILFIAGGAALISSFLLYILRTETREVLPSEMTVGLLPVPEGGLLTVGGAF